MLKVYTPPVRTDNRSCIRSNVELMLYREIDGSWSCSNSDLRIPSALVRWIEASLNSPRISLVIELKLWRKGWEVGEIRIAGFVLPPVPVREIAADWVVFLSDKAGRPVRPDK